MIYKKTRVNSAFKNTKIGIWQAPTTHETLDGPWTSYIVLSMVLPGGSLILEVSKHNSGLSNDSKMRKMKYRER